MDNIKPFADSISSKIKYLKNYEEDSIYYKNLRSSIQEDLKKCSNIITPRTSRKASALAKKKKIKLSELRWDTQTKFDQKRANFHWEHYNTVANLGDKCIELKTRSKILNFLHENLIIVWVLKSENKKLDTSGFRSNRPNSKGAYKKTGIILKDF